MAHKIVVTLLHSMLAILAVSRIEATRQLMQHGYYPSNQYQPAYGQDYGGGHDNFLSSHLEAKKDFAHYAIDKAKSLIEEHKGKGSPVMQVSAPTYVVTSQPQIMVAPLPQLAPTVVAAAPQPAPAPPKIEYVPVPVKQTVVKPVIVPIPIPKLKPEIPKPEFPKFFFKGIAKGLKNLAANLNDSEDTEDTDVPAAPVAAAMATLPPVPVPSAPAEQVFPSAPTPNPSGPAQIVPNPTAQAAPTGPTFDSSLIGTTAPQPTAPATVQPAPPATTITAATGSTVIAGARTTAPAPQPTMTAAPQPAVASSTFRPVQVLQVQNQVNNQGKIVGQAYGVAAAGR